MSKYRPEAFGGGARYYQGNRSPNDAEREVLGYSGAWMHHMGRNKHHYEYWHDYDKQGNMVPVPMPGRYIAEMLMDRIAACKVYEGKKYTNASPLAYYKKGKAVNDIMHDDTRQILERILRMLAEKGEDKTFAYIRQELVMRKRNFLWKKDFHKKGLYKIKK